MSLDSAPSELHSTKEETERESPQSATLSHATVFSCENQRIQSKKIDLEHQRKKDKEKNCLLSFKKRKPKSLSLDCPSSNHEQQQRLEERTKQKSPQLPVLGLGPVFTIENRRLSKKGKDKENIDLPSFENQTLHLMSHRAQKKRPNRKWDNQLSSAPCNCLHFREWKRSG